MSKTRKTRKVQKPVKPPKSPKRAKPARPARPATATAHNETALTFAPPVPPHDPLRHVDRALLLYLAENVPETVPVYASTPPDLKRCQCEWRDQTEDTFGPKPTVRCEERTVVVAFQKRVQGSAVPTGAIGLCDNHRILLEHMHPDQCYFRAVTSDRIGELVG